MLYLFRGSCLAARVAWHLRPRSLVQSKLYDSSSTIDKLPIRAQRFSDHALAAAERRVRFRDEAHPAAHQKDNGAFHRHLIFLMVKYRKWIDHRYLWGKPIILANSWLGNSPRTRRTERLHRHCRSQLFARLTALFSLRFAAIACARLIAQAALRKPCKVDRNNIRLRQLPKSMVSAGA